nr:hypothetical protein [Fusarium oxysporum]
MRRRSLVRYKLWQMVREEWRLALLHCKLKAKSSKDGLVVIHLRGGASALVYSFSMRIFIR